MSGTRRLQVGSARYVDSGSGWRKIIETKNGGTVRLTTGEAAYVEEIWRREHAARVTPA